MKKFCFFLILSALVFLNQNSPAQQQRAEAICRSQNFEQYFSDGNIYFTQLRENDLAQYNVVFYEGLNYRIAVCSASKNTKLIYKLYDKEHHLLFSNASKPDAVTWDFRFKSTIPCTIETQISNYASGEEIPSLLIGFNK